MEGNNHLSMSTLRDGMPPLAAPGDRLGRLRKQGAIAAMHDASGSTIEENRGKTNAITANES